MNPEETLAEARVQLARTAFRRAHEEYHAALIALRDAERRKNAALAAQSTAEMEAQAVRIRLAHAGAAR